jgi:membrane protein required for colicin V production
MNFLDVAIVVIILFGGYLGFRKGLVIELCSLAALVGGVYFGMKFSEFVSTWILSLLSSPNEYVPLIAFGCCFLAIVILVFFLGKWLEKFVKLSMLKPIDRILGGVFAAGKYLLIVAILLWLFEKWYQGDQALITYLENDSLLFRKLVDLAGLITPVWQEKWFG